MAKINPEFSKEIKKYGSVDFNACYNCGNCTAVCTSTEENANFPRKFIRYGLLGMKDEILTSKELWMCYSCGDCSETCPKGAEPGNYMATLRRYAMASYEPSGLTKLIFKSNPFSIILSLILAIIFGFFLLSIKPDDRVSRWLFNWIPYEVIHNIGLIIIGISVIFGVAGLLNMYLRLLKKYKRKKKNPNFLKDIIKASYKVINELITMKNYQKCDIEEDSLWFSKPFIVKPWFVHWTIMWGFIGLLLATIINFLFKDPALTVWLPSRILGTVSGILLMYGSTLAIIYRLKSISKAYSLSKLSDWMFLFFLWIAGFTGFWLEIAVTFDIEAMSSHIIFIIHTIISMELVVLFIFSKFAHVIYRPLALFIHYYYKEI